jgi:hypothetical protein
MNDRRSVCACAGTALSPCICWSLLTSKPVSGTREASFCFRIVKFYDMPGFEGRCLGAGGTICQVLQEIVDRGAVPENIRVVSIVAAAPALNLMSERFEGMCVYTAMIDAEVNEHGFIVPGLGDAGDRCYGTL